MVEKRPSVILIRAVLVESMGLKPDCKVLREELEERKMRHWVGLGSNAGPKNLEVKEGRQDIG